ncbi:MAG: hypothetical protein NZ455_16505, partial [Bacteroidia bacterium]|nr:hypothetical protein [Bacteroidia bacterium]
MRFFFTIVIAAVIWVFYEKPIKEAVNHFFSNSQKVLQNIIAKREKVLQNIIAQREIEIIRHAMDLNNPTTR